MPIETLETDAILSAAEFVGVEPNEAEAIITIYNGYKKQHTKSEQPDEMRIAYHERGFDEMKDIFLLESLRCAGFNNCEPALWMGICRSAMKRLSALCLPKRESGEVLSKFGKQQ